MIGAWLKLALVRHLSAPYTNLNTILPPLAYHICTTDKISMSVAEIIARQQATMGLTYRPPMISHDIRELCAATRRLVPSYQPVCEEPIVTFIDDWRDHIPTSLGTFAGLITSPADVQLGFLAAAVLWPIHEIAIDDEAANLTLRQIVGDDADRLLALIRSWPNDRRAAAENLALRMADDAVLQVALTRLVSTMLAPAHASDGAVQSALTNFIIHIGDTITVTDVPNGIINVKSSLDNVEQRIDAAVIDADTKALLRQLLAQITAHSVLPKPARQTVFDTTIWKVLAISLIVISVVGGISGLYLDIPQILNPAHIIVPTIMLPPTSVPPTSTPVRRLQGDLNIAVAAFGSLDSQGHVVPSQEAEDLSNSVYNRLDQEISTFSTLSDTFDIDRLAPQYTGPITGTTREERAQAAERLARTINADIIIYGNLKSGAAEFIPEFYISDRKLIEAQELTGQYELGSPIDGGSDITVNPAARKQMTAQLLTRTQALAQFILGLGYYALDKFGTAEHYFRLAEDIKAWDDHDGKEVLYLLLGNSALVREDWSVAQIYYDHALQLNPDYARAQMGGAEIALARASQDECQPGSVDQATLDQAIQGYRTALAAQFQPALSDIPTKGALGLGRAYLCMSLAQIADRVSNAQAEFAKVITEYTTGNQRVKELASQAYFGNAQILADRGEYRRAAQEYQQGIELTRKPMNQAIVYISLAQLYLQLNECGLSSQKLEQADEAYKRAQSHGQKPKPWYERRRLVVGDDVANAICPTPTAIGT